MTREEKLARELAKKLMEKIKLYEPDYIPPGCPEWLLPEHLRTPSDKQMRLFDPQAGLTDYQRYIQG